MDKIELHYQTPKVDQVPEISVKIPETLRKLERECREVVLKGHGSVLLGLRRFNTDDSYELDYSDGEIAIVRGQLSLQGFDSDIRMVMDSKCRKTIMDIFPRLEIEVKKVQGGVLN